MPLAIRRVIAGIVLVVGMQVGITAIATPVSAAGCYGYSCHGFDPIARSCPVSSTTVTYGAYATVWNRYSNVCKANWAKAQLTPTAIGRGYQWLVYVWTVDSRGLSEQACEPTPDGNLGYLNERCAGPINPAWSGYGSSWYTDMVDGTNVTTATVAIYQPATATWPQKIIAQYSARQ